MYDEDVAYDCVPGNASDKQTRQADWNVAKGLQQVDGLTTSPYLDEVEEGHVEGTYTSAQAAQIVYDYYRSKAQLATDRNAEADIVSARIVHLLEEGGFSMRPNLLKHIHGSLFEGLVEQPYDFGWRDYNITKGERILAGETVQYAPWQLIEDNLRYDFDEARSCTLLGPASSGEGGIARFVTFVSNIWQTHAFVEGNTRTVAVFCILYLRSCGYHVNNEPFSEHAKFFRNALVRANYSSIPLGIEEDPTHLTHFFGNVLFGTGHELHNRDLYCDALFEAKSMPLPSQAFARSKSEPDR